jgi:DNA polymerase III psi subunit
MAKEAPDGLAEAGELLWSQIAGVYELRPDELATLEDVCRLTDMVAALEAAWAEDGRPLTTKGSMGQLVTHPLISEIRTHRMARNALWRQMKLPDVVAVPEANQHRAAAQSRWSAAHGKAG